MNKNKHDSRSLQFSNFSRVTRQAGMGSLGWLAVISLGFSMLFLAFRIAPVYLDDSKVVGVLKSVAKERTLADQSKEEIRAKLSKFLTVNSVRHQDVKDFKIVSMKQRYFINNEYEIRVPIIANISVVLAFRHQLDTRNPDKCCVFLQEKVSNR